MFLEKVWKFLWKDDSVWSWIVSIILAFLIVKFIVYPLLGLIFGTGFPIVAVVSGSMEHGPNCPSNGLDCGAYTMCGKTFDDKGHYSVDAYWDECGEWYLKNNITLSNFKKFPFNNGFNKGDVMILFGAEAKNIKVGDVVVFEGNLDYPIIHRVVKVWKSEGQYFLRTKGDNNGAVSSTEERIVEDRLVGKAVLRLPLLGWVKIKFSEAINSILGK